MRDRDFIGQGFIRRGHRQVGVVLVSVGALILSAGSVPASASVVGHWRLDEEGGQSVRDAAGGPDGMLGTSSEPDGADPTRIAGRWGGALSFDGGDRVTIPDRSQLEPARISVEAWVRRTGTPGDFRYVVSKGGTRCLASSYGLYSGSAAGLAFYVSDATRYVLSPAVPTDRIWDGRWHYAVGSYDGSRVRLYLDGAQVGSGVPVELEIRYRLASTTPLIGSFLGSCERPFTGDIDEVRLWNEALDATRVTRFAAAGPDAGSAPPASPPSRPTPIPADPSAPGGVYPIPGAPVGPRPPAVTAASVSPATWRLASVPTTSPGNQPVGTTIRFTLSAPARVTLTFHRLVSGRRVAGRCVAPSRRNRGASRCVRPLSVGTLTVAGRSGRNRVPFRGRLSGRRSLRPGLYVLRVRARDSKGRIGASRTVAFRVLSR